MAFVSDFFNLAWYFKVHLCFTNTAFLLLLNNAQLYYLLHFASPFVSWWTFVLFSFFGYYEITLLLSTFVYKAFYGCRFSVFLVTPSVELLITGHFFFLTFWGDFRTVSKVHAPFYPKQQCVRFQFLHIIDNTCYCLTVWLLPSSWVCYLIMVLMCIFLMTNSVEYFFMWLLVICISSLRTYYSQLLHI